MLAANWILTSKSRLEHEGREQCLSKSGGNRSDDSPTILWYQRDHAICQQNLFHSWRFQPRHCFYCIGHHTGDYVSCCSWTDGQGRTTDFAHGICRGHGSQQLPRGALLLLTGGKKRGPQEKRTFPAEKMSDAWNTFIGELALISLLVYIVAYSLGMGAIPWIIMSFQNRQVVLLARVRPGRSRK